MMLGEVLGTFVSTTKLVLVLYENQALLANDWNAPIRQAIRIVMSANDLERYTPEILELSTRKRNYSERFLCFNQE